MKIVTCGTRLQESALIVNFLRSGGTATLQPSPGRGPFQVLGGECVCCGVETMDYSAHIPRCRSVEWDAIGSRDRS
jgi:hypothetical protein